VFICIAHSITQLRLRPCDHLLTYTKQQQKTNLKLILILIETNFKLKPIATMTSNFILLLFLNLFLQTWIDKESGGTINLKVVCF
jgi:hypothetical protein